MTSPQHRSILAPSATSIPTSKIPPTTGSISICPATHSTYEYYSSSLFKNLQDDGGSDEAAFAPLSEETVGLIWLDSGGAPAASKLGEVLRQYPRIKWVQLGLAGVNAFEQLIKSRKDIVWTSAKVSTHCGQPQAADTFPQQLILAPSSPHPFSSQGSFAQPVAEHALSLLLSLLRNIPKRIRASSWGTPSGLSLFSRHVTILGAGGITLALLALLAPFEVEVTVLRRRAEPLEEEVLPSFYRAAGGGKLNLRSFKELHAVLPSSDILVLAAALTSETHGIIGSSELSLLPKHAVLVNVARGEHVQTAALLSALQRGVISGAGLDVTDPEPLPEDHPLWSLQRDSDAAYEEELCPDQRGNLIITPHTADTPEMVKPLLVQRFVANARALKAGEGRFEGVVDPEWAY